jgi:hypothetical protein
MKLRGVEESGYPPASPLTKGIEGAWQIMRKSKFHCHKPILSFYCQGGNDKRLRLFMRLPCHEPPRMRPERLDAHLARVFL